MKNYKLNPTEDELVCNGKTFYANRSLEYSCDNCDIKNDCFNDLKHGEFCLSENRNDGTDCVFLLHSEEELKRHEKQIRFLITSLNNNKRWDVLLYESYIQYLPLKLQGKARDLCEDAEGSL
jgi:hypothetical protein